MINFFDVTIVIAAKDEAPSIADVVRGSRRWCREVIVVDGHSTDGTPQVARSAGARVVRDRGRGKGDAIRTAIPEITTPITVFIDADGSHDPADIPKLVAPIRSGDADHVSASRLIGGSSELHGGFDECFRLAGCAFITACVNRRFGVCLSDTQNGYRAIRTDVLRAIGLRENSTTIEQEMVMKTLAAGYRVAEIPSHEHPRLHGHSHINIWRVMPRYAYCLIANLAVRRAARAIASAPMSAQLPATAGPRR